MRLIHTSDWQIGKAYGFADDATREILRNERLEAIGRLGQLAQQHGAAIILVAGDIYEVAAPTDRTLRKPVERTPKFPNATRHVIPGNHDPHTMSGPWNRLSRMGLPDNVVLHLTPEAVELGAGGAFLVPSVLTRRHAATRPR